MRFQMPRILFCVILLAVFCMQPIKETKAQQQSKILNTIKLSNKAVTVDGLSAEYHSSSQIMVVRAKIKNTSRTLIRGYVTIYLLSDGGQVLFTHLEDVNNGREFAHGTIVDFETTAVVGNLADVGAISVDFTQR